MSTYRQWTKHPATERWELATWIDDHFGRHHYGVKFSDGPVYDPDEPGLRLITSINEAEAAILNAALSKS